MRLHSSLFFFTLASVVIALYSCSEEPTKPPVQPTKPTIKLEVQYADFTEVLLKITVSDTSSWKNVAIKRDGSLARNYTFIHPDTVIIDGGLKSNSDYRYRAYLLERGNPIDSSSLLTVHTLDTTTHNWRFEIDTIGAHNSGALSVIAFARDDAWAAGRFIVEDDVDPQKWNQYGLAHWEGMKWTLIPIRHKNDPSLLLEATLLYAFNRNDFWLISGRGIEHNNGQGWTQVKMYNPQMRAMEKMWGLSSSDLIFVGGGGDINHWNGSKLMHIDSPTTIDLRDIYGEKKKIYMVGVTIDNTRSVILQMTNGKIEVIDSTRSQGQWSVASVWFRDEDSVLAYAGNWQKIYHRGLKIAQFDGFRMPFCEYVRGTGVNNIWFAGHFNYLLHYNGSSWKYYTETARLGGGILFSLDVKEDYLFAAGFIEYIDGTLRGVIIRGYRM